MLEEIVDLEMKFQIIFEEILTSLEEHYVVVLLCVPCASRDVIRLCDDVFEK